MLRIHAGAQNHPVQLSQNRSKDKKQVHLLIDKQTNRDEAQIYNNPLQILLNMSQSYLYVILFYPMIE